MCLFLSIQYTGIQDKHHKTILNKTRNLQTLVMLCLKPDETKLLYVLEFSPPQREPLHVHWRNMTSLSKPSDKLLHHRTARLGYEPFLPHAV